MVVGRMEAGFAQQQRRAPVEIRKRNGTFEVAPLKTFLSLRRWRREPHIVHLHVSLTYL